MSHINLMTGHAKVRQCCRTRLRQWSLAWGGLFTFLAVATVVLYLPSYRRGLERDTLEVRAEVVVKLRAINKKLAREIEQIRKEEQFALGLSRKIPVVTVLGLVGQAVASTDDRLIVERLLFDGISVTSKNTAGSSTVLAVGGTAVGEPAIDRFANAMQEALPFANVQLEEKQDISTPGRTLHGFTLECTF